MEQIIQVSSREFRANQKDYFELADNGIQIILRRGRKQAYILTPVDDEDLFLSPALQERINRSLQEIKEGKTKSYTLDELRNRMGV
jgi:Phd_YefM.